MLTEHNYSYLKFLRTSLSTLVAPMQYLAEWPFDIATWVETSFSSHRALLAENAHLRANDFFMRAKIQKLEALERENNQLRKLLDSLPRERERVLIARLLAANSDPFVHEVVLDQGEQQDVYVGQPVLDAFGIVGQVIDVGPVTSRVLLVTDSRSAVPVQDSRNGVRAIAIGVGKVGDLQLIHVPETVDIKVGDLLTTSGLGQHFPPGYPVGVVRAVSYNAGERFATINVVPKALLNRSRLVLLVWPTDQGAEMRVNKDAV